MIVEDQSEVIDFLQDPATHDGTSVERFDTHISIVFLAGRLAYKLKRAVRFGYLDFSTVERRAAACAAEIALNRRAAPQLYLEVKTVGRDIGGRLRFDGEGATVDSVVVMRRFDQDCLFDRLAQRGALSRALISELADRIVSFHRTAEIDSRFGGYAGLAALIEGNDANLLASPAIFDREVVMRVSAESRAALARIRDLVDTRRRQSKVRLCHGDLHLRNVCLFEGRPTLFDCIEFSREIACVDVLYDISFLLMDLAHRRLPDLANAAFNRYFDLEAEVEGAGTFPLYLSIHAAIRAHVTAAAVPETSGEKQKGLIAEARAYFDLARSSLRIEEPRLIAIGGVSGTGKSTLAYGLAPGIGGMPGARVLRSDVLRKRLMGLPPEARLSDEAYGEAVTAAVYAALHEEAARLLRQQRSVVLDAVFLRPSERAKSSELAREWGIAFQGLWLDAAEEVLTARIANRHYDPSDATLEVLRQQLSLSPGRIEWRRLQAGGSSSQVLHAASENDSLSV